MADKTESTETEETQDGQTQEPDQEAFWTRFQTETAKVVDARLAERDRKRQSSRRSDAKRTTLPGVIADIMFGKQS